MARREAEGIFADGAGNGGLNWVTDKTRDNLGKLAWKVGGNHNVTWRPPFLKNKGGLEATYELTPAEVAQFRRAWGPDFNWNFYQWYKGLAGQYYFRPKPATAGQRLKELGQAAGLTAPWGVPLANGINESIKQQKVAAEMNAADERLRELEERKRRGSAR